jgi:hypothetical protein
VTVFLNTDELCMESLHCSKSFLEEVDNGVAIMGSGEKFLVLASIPGNYLGDNMV